MRAASLLLLAAAAALAGPRTFSSPNGAHTLTWRGTSFLLKGPDAEFRGEAKVDVVDAHVLDARPAAVVRGRGTGVVLALIDAERGWSVDYKTLFRDAPRAKWARTWWVDEARGQAVVVHADGRAREVSLADGKSRPATPHAFFSAFRLPHAREQALEVAADVQPEGVRAVVEKLLLEKDLPAGVRVRAAIVRERAGGAPVPRGLFAAALQGADAPAAGALLHAAVASGAKDLHRRVQAREPELLAALDKQTGPIGWLADHFRLLPTTEAVKPLLRALQRHARHPDHAPRLIAALKACTGLDFGPNPQTWLEKTPLR